MSMLGRRLQILIDDERYERLTAEARRRKTSVATVVREAIDRVADASDRRRSEAAARILAAPRMSVPDIRGLRRELDEIRAGAKD